MRTGGSLAQILSVSKLIYRAVLTIFGALKTEVEEGKPLLGLFTQLHVKLNFYEKLIQNVDGSPASGGSRGL